MRTINPYFDRQPPDVPDDAEFDQVDNFGRRFRKVGNCIEYEDGGCVLANAPTEFDQVDNFGRRFRKVGNCIEYEPEINGIPRSVFFASQKAQKIRDEENRKREREEQAARQTNRNCPFKEGRNQVHTSCEKDCPFYDGGCVLANAPTAPTDDTKGKYCPIAGRCTERCAMYNHGCNLIQIFKCMKHGKE